MDKAKQLGRSRNARLNQASQQLSCFAGSLANLIGEEANKVNELKNDWQDGRNALEQIVQCFHEANAYNNALKAIKGK